MSQGISFINTDFLLKNDQAKVLYHDYAAQLPIIDYHNHLSPKQIGDNFTFPNITQLWLDGDHYKWRALRTLGVEEKYITGHASDREKFLKFAEATPYMVRNPLYHWTHLELSRYFDINELLSANNAVNVYEETAALLQTEAFTTQALLHKMNVETLCTTEDPIDTLEHHIKLKKSAFKTKVSTAFRPDQSLFIRSEKYNSYLDQLGEAADHEIVNYTDLCKALRKRMEFFHNQGCRLSDHGLEYLPYLEATESDINRIFKNRRHGEMITKDEEAQFQTALLLFLGKSYHTLGWVQQFHLGAMRNNNTRMYHKLGPDTGWDSIGSYPQAHGLSRFLDALDQTNQLTKTILYNLNPADNEIMATMIGNFNDGSSRGKVQWGSGWWFLDQLEGMTDQINTLSNMGMISCFIGMLTDSRSFLSFPRHEYFRRLICNLFGEDMKKGQIPNDLEFIGGIIQEICYRNAKSYFNF
jgi:glucuronate isomerase|tara:strand:- start:1927 stop:3333 length:1407 start_codon:yes stop_codon:yes gene_type:complete